MDIDGDGIDKIAALRGQVGEIVGYVDMLKAQELANKSMQSFRDKYGLLETHPDDK